MLRCLSPHAGALLALLLAVSAGSAEPAVRPPVRIYGLELATEGEHDRLLVFGDGAVEPLVEETDAEHVLLRFPRAVLDPTAPRSLHGGPDAALLGVEALEVPGVEAPEVRLRLQRLAGIPPQLARRGALLAVDFERPVAPASAGIELHFQQEELAQVVESIARAAGEIFVFDESLVGRVSVGVTERVDAAEALEILHAILRLEGFAAVPTPGGAWRVLPLDRSGEGAPWKEGEPSAASDAPVATLLRLHSASAKAVYGALQPWLGASLLAVPIESHNAIVLAGSERRLRGLFHIVRMLDRASAERLWVRTLRFRGAEEVAGQVRAAFGDGLPGDSVEVWADPQANQLVARASPARIEALRNFVERVDRAPESGGVLNVLKLRHADPEELARLLLGLATGAAPAAGPARAVGLAGRDFSVVAEPRTHALLVRADPDTFATLRDVVAELDQAPRRIHVEVILLEVAMSNTLELGFDAILPFGDLDSGLVGHMVLNPSGGGLRQPGGEGGPAFALRGERGLLIPIVDALGNPLELLVPRERFVVTADDREIHTRVLMRPHLQLLNGEEHELFAGDNVPVPVSAISDDGASRLETRVDVQRQDVGVRLRVRPSLGARGAVQLELDLEASRLVPSQAGDVQAVGPTIEQRHLQTRVTLEDDEIAVVATASQPAFQSSEAQTPYLGSVPILGNFFRSGRDQKLETRLLIAVQARIQEGDEEVVAETIRRRTGLERVLAQLTPLGPEEGAPYALRVTTRVRESDARDIAEHWRARGQEAQVVPWSWEGERRFDVVLTGFPSVAEAAEVGLWVRDEGWSPELVVRPPADRP